MNLYVRQIQYGVYFLFIFRLFVYCNLFVVSVYLITLVKNVSLPVWIGLNARNTGYRHGYFVWQDNSEVSFTNWAKGEPNNIYGYMTVIYIYHFFCLSFSLSLSVSVYLFLSLSLSLSVSLSVSVSLFLSLSLSLCLSFSLSLSVSEGVRCSSMVRVFAHDAMGRCSNQCSTTGVTKAVVCVILSVG